MVRTPKIAFVDFQLKSSIRKEGHRLGREPIGLLELGAYVQQATVCDISYIVAESEEDAAKRIVDCNPDIVGFSAYTYNYPSAVRTAKAIRARDQNIRVVFGGPHIAGTDSQLETELRENRGFIDAYIKGEGERAFLDFLNGRNGVISGEKLPMHEIPLAHRDPSLMESDRITLPGYEKCRAAIVVASRGCTRGCDFCLSRKTGYRAKPIELVIGEMKHLIDNYGVNVLIFEDPLLNGDHKYLNELCSKIASEREEGRFGKDFVAIGMCDFVFGSNPRELLQTMKQAGFAQINWGVEDPRQAYRDLMNKKVKIQADILKAATDVEIFNRGLLMLPTNIDAPDPKRDTEEYVEGLLGLSLDEAKVNITTPFRGTPLYERLLGANKIIDFDWSRYDTHHLVFEAGNWTPEIVEESRRHILDAFNSYKANPNV